MNRPPAPDLYGKGKLPEVQSFADEWYSEWNIDGMSVGQIRQVIDIIMFNTKSCALKEKLK